MVPILKTGSLLLAAHCIYIYIFVSSKNIFATFFSNLHLLMYGWEIYYMYRNDMRTTIKKKCIQARLGVLISEYNFKHSKFVMYVCVCINRTTKSWNCLCLEPVRAGNQRSSSRWILFIKMDTKKKKNDRFSKRLSTWMPSVRKKKEKKRTCCRYTVHN